MVTAKNKISRRIIDKLRLNHEKILIKDEITKTIKEYSRVYKTKVNLISLWTYLRKDNYVKRILGNYYYVYSLEERYNHYCKFSEEELIFLVLEKMKIKWYLGLESALKENKITWQALNIVTIINNHFSGIKKLGNSKFRFIKTKNNKFKFGLIKKKTNNSVTYLYSDLEKTYLDFLYFSSYKGKDIKTLKKSLDFKVEKIKVIKYAKYYSNQIQGVI
ncbi:MAG TPA: hypothetical protein VMZ91_03690 [Candidatus Paceibacterota bacterium]|nr:hypothetical protein [Candidatus Paceibacterota bacterium]